MEKDYFLNSATPPPPFPLSVSSRSSSDCIKNVDMGTKGLQYVNSSENSATFATLPRPSSSAPPPWPALIMAVHSPNTLCYSTPLSSHPKLQLPSLGNHTPPLKRRIDLVLH
nr:transcription factor bHLH62-like isoform X1 [Ipomoea batatas]